MLQLPQDSSFFLFVWFVFVLFFSSKFGFIWGRRGCKGRGQMRGVKEMSGIRMYDVKSTENQWRKKTRRRLSKPWGTCQWAGPLLFQSLPPESWFPFMVDVACKLKSTFSFLTSFWSWRLSQQQKVDWNIPLFFFSNEEKVSDIIL